MSLKRYVKPRVSYDKLKFYSSQLLFNVLFIKSDAHEM